MVKDSFTSSSPYDFDSLLQAAITSNNEEEPWFDTNDSGFMDLLTSVFGEENTVGKNPQFDGNQEQNLIISHEIEQEETIQRKKLLNEKQDSNYLASWEILNSYGRGFKSSIAEIENPNSTHESRLSMEEILRLGGEQFIQFSTNRIDGISTFINPYGSSHSSLSITEARDVEIIHLLLSAADNLSKKNFEFAENLISRCLSMASGSGTPTQRVGFYLAEALRERFNRESKGVIRNHVQKIAKNPLALGTNNAFLASHQEMPFSQVMQFAAIQSIIENVNKPNGKIHLIDLQIRSGVQWTALIQGISEFSIRRLKITAIVTTDQKKVEETGIRLTSFAQSLNLCFSFKAVYLTNMSEFNEDLLEIESDETVAVYSNLMLRSMISRPDCLENLMKSITKVKPVLMIVIEVEANHNSSSFIDRFVEALFFYGAFFDCLEDSMDCTSESRKVLEGSFFGEGIMNMVSTEGEERVTRNIKVDVWRAFLSRFGMCEIGLSESSVYQASLVLKRFVHGSSCTIECGDDRKGLIVGWKGTPLHSLTAWKWT